MFNYGVDFVLSDFSNRQPLFFSRNRFNFWSLWDVHHGGPIKEGRGIEWFSDLLTQRGFATEDAELLLLAQPSFLWFHFNPVSFWIALKDDKLCAVVAEVNSTFGQRHCYFCAHEGFRPIEYEDGIKAEKLMHVSPFQKNAGQYQFNFGISKTAVKIRIAFENGDQGVLATLAGDRKPATNASLLWAAVRRPFGSARVVALIHWQAAILYLKRAPFLKKQPAPHKLLSDNHKVSEQSL